jgi:hypothetical protein
VGVSQGGPVVLLVLIPASTAAGVVTRCTGDRHAWLGARRPCGGPIVRYEARVFEMDVNNVGDGNTYDVHESDAVLNPLSAN